LVARTVEGENLVNRSSTSHDTAPAIAAAVLVSLATFAGATLAAEGTTAIGRTTVTTQTTTVSTQTTPGVNLASKADSDADDKRIRALHDRLMVKTSQEALWQDVAQVMRSNDDKMDALTTERHDKRATMTAVEDLRSYGEITEQHASGIKAFVPAFERLYDSMSAAQKANADTVFRSEGHKATKTVK
jgi:hypothetical protein